jgi:hypothetical protein
LFAFTRYWRKKWEYNETVHHLLVDFKKAYDSVTKEVLYNIHIEFGAPVKLVRLVMCLNETCGKSLWGGKHLSDMFPVQNCLKLGDNLSSLLCNFALEYTIMKVQEDQVGLKLNEAHQFLVCVDNVNLLENNINTIKRNTEAVTDASIEVVLEVNTEKTKYMLMSDHQNARQYHNIKVTNRSFETVAKFKCLEVTVINTNLIHEKIKSRLSLCNACYHLVQNISASHLLSKNIKIKIYKTIILPLVLYGHETWSLTLRKDVRLKGGEIVGGWRRLHEDLQDLCFLLNITRIFKARMMRWE